MAEPAVCKFFLKGECARGDTCWYVHDKAAREKWLQTNRRKRKRGSATPARARKAPKVEEGETPGQAVEGDSSAEIAAPPSHMPRRRATPQVRLPAFVVPRRGSHQAPFVPQAPGAAAEKERFKTYYSEAKYIQQLLSSRAQKKLCAKALPTLVGRKQSTLEFFKEIGNLLLEVDPDEPSRVFSLLAVLAPPGFGKTTFLGCLCHLTGVPVGDLPKIPFKLTNVAPSTAVRELWTQSWPVYVTFNDGTMLNEVDNLLMPSERLSLRIIYALFHPHEDFVDFGKKFLRFRHDPTNGLFGVDLSLKNVISACLDIIKANSRRSAIFLAVDELMKLEQVDANAVLSELGSVLDSIDRKQFNLIVSTLSDSPQILANATSNSGRPVAWIPLHRVKNNQLALLFSEKAPEVTPLVELLKPPSSAEEVFHFLNDPEEVMETLLARRKAQQLVTAVAACGGHMRSVSQLFGGWSPAFGHQPFFVWLKSFVDDPRRKFRPANFESILGCILAALKGDPVQLSTQVVGQITAKVAIDSNYFMNSKELSAPPDHSFVPMVSLVLLYRWVSHTLSSPPATNDPTYQRKVLLADTLQSILSFADQFLWQHAEEFVALIISIRSCLHHGATISISKIFAGGNRALLASKFADRDIRVNLINFDVLKSKFTCLKALQETGIGAPPNCLWRLCTFAPNNPGFDLLILLPYKKRRYVAVALEVKHSVEEASTTLTLAQIVEKHRLAEEQLQPLLTGDAKHELKVQHWYLIFYASRTVHDEVVSSSLPRNVAVLDRDAMSSFCSPTLATLPGLNFSQ